MSNIGGLPYLFKDERFKDAKIYATTPVAKLGFYMFVDAFVSKLEQSDFNLLSDVDITTSFLNITEVKYKENIEIKYKDGEIVITPIPSGFSFGGACWKIGYKLHSILYAPQCAIESLYICDPFPYELFKNPNILITDSKYSKALPVQKYVIENKLKENILNLLENEKNIFIPCDSANICIDLIIKIEKILNEFSKNKSKESEKNEVNYKVLICGYSSYEIIESVKSLVEFMGSSISRQFYTYNENPFNLKYVQCIKDFNEYQEVRKSKNTRHIVLTSFESLDIGLSHKILPDILKDKDFFIFLVSYYEKKQSNTLKRLIKAFKNGDSSFRYREIKRIIDQEALSNILLI
jgi:cleavage and polyadenylation specificity factor subunit 2